MSVENSVDEFLDFVSKNEPSETPIGKGHDAYVFLRRFDQLAEAVMKNDPSTIVFCTELFYPINDIAKHYSEGRLTPNEALGMTYDAKKKAFSYLREKGYDARLAMNHFDSKSRQILAPIIKSKQLIREADKLLKEAKN